MAKTLSKDGIITGQKIKIEHITQSIDALTGIEDYDINISGSLDITGSLDVLGGSNITGILNGGKITPLLLKNSSSTNNTAVSLRLQTDPLSNVNSYSEIVGLRTGSPTTGGNRMIFLTTSATAGSASERMRLDYLGLGIGSFGTTTITDSRLGRFADGTANSPAYAFSNDVSTGMYRIGTNILGFSTAGSEKMRINSNGNISIGGTTNNSYKLNIQGDISLVSGNESYAIISPSQSNQGMKISVGDPADALLPLITFNGTYQTVKIGPSTSLSKLAVKGGDIEVEDIASGIILKSPNGTRYRITVADNGILNTLAV